MAQTAANADVRLYLETVVPPDARGAVKRLRALIRAAAPKAVESRSYGILGYKIDGRPFVYCGGFKQHVALYPVTAAMQRDHGDAIAPFQASKGTLKFPLDTPLPVALITRLLKTRLKELRARPSKTARRR
jgi:uncharacterized protein YdhG (YjbR/CyaY superfamily)